ncbi:MAG: winged helix-turn-helix domain-containing protein, partial [Nitrospinae bacterium]|nr:winged helix-turn-helix domain-containing protein [Nitrospinota bacterium]
NIGRVVTHGMLLKEVWGPHSVEHTQYLRVYMGKIRKKLRFDGDKRELITTESGVGYRLLVE